MKQKIIKLRLEGKSYNEINAILGCSKGTISYHCSKLKQNNKVKGINLNIKNKKQIKDDSFLLPNNETIEKIVSLRKIEKSYKEISIELGISIDLISKTCRKLGLLSTRRFNRISDEGNIIKLYQELKSTRKVAKILGISRETVSKYANIERRTKLTDKEIKEKNAKGVVNWRKRTKVKLVEYKGGKCSKCGYNKSYKALEFHHIDPNEKDFTISGKSWSFERLKNEVDKCDLLCANCHIETHEGF